MGRDKLVARFDEFAARKWHDLILASVKCSTDAAVVTRRHRRRGCPNTMEKRASRALKLFQVGELSAGRHALEGADLADGNTATLKELRQRPANPRDPVPPVPVDGLMFNLAARKGAAGGPSGVTNDHLRPLLDERHTFTVQSGGVDDQR